jgi:regulator of sigma E protease
MEVLIKSAQLLLSLSILIVLHEMGHFAPAKWFNTRVEKFYLFFDFAPFNSLFKYKKGDTEYGIGWLPLGGYVKISGMVDESMDTEALKLPPQPWEFRSKPAWQRLIIMLGGVTVNFVLGIFLFAMILLVWGETVVPMSEIKNGLAMDSLLIRQGFRNGDHILKIGNEPFPELDPGKLISGMMSAKLPFAAMGKSTSSTYQKMQPSRSLAKKYPKPCSCNHESPLRWMMWPQANQPKKPGYKKETRS